MAKISYVFFSFYQRQLLRKRTARGIPHVKNFCTLTKKQNKQKNTWCNLLHLGDKWINKGRKLTFIDWLVISDSEVGIAYAILQVPDTFLLTFFFLNYSIV